MEQAKDNCSQTQNQNEADAWPFKSKPNKNPDAIEKPPRVFPGACLKDPQISSGEDDDYYNMNNPKRGVALIFNHTHFENMPSRSGTERDCQNLQDVMRYLHFETRVYEDLTQLEILEVLDDVAAEDHTDADCFVMVVMTHGNSGILHSRDYKYPVDVLWTKFTGDNCPTLAGKPKLIFIQACRGDEVDHGVRLTKGGDQTDASARQESYSIPVNADTLVMFSTFAGHVSFREPGVGSWFIRALCGELREKAATHSLLDILTFASRRVAIKHASCMNNPLLHKKKQMPTIVSHLIRIVHFGQSNKQLKK